MHPIWCLSSMTPGSCLFFSFLILLFGPVVGLKSWLGWLWTCDWLTPFFSSRVLYQLFIKKKKILCQLLLKTYIFSGFTSRYADTEFIFGKISTKKTIPVVWEMEFPCRRAYKNREKKKKRESTEACELLLGSILTVLLAHSFHRLRDEVPFNLREHVRTSDFNFSHALRDSITEA